MKFDPELTGNLLEEVLQINIVDMGQVNKSENELLVYKRFTVRRSNVPESLWNTALNLEVSKNLSLEGAIAIISWTLLWRKPRTGPDSFPRDWRKIWGGSESARISNLY